MYFDNPHGSAVGPVLRHCTRRPRIAFYSHDTMGMGHLRRNLLIATALTTGSLQAESLIISGAREAAFFTEQAGIDCVTFACVAKRSRGHVPVSQF